MSTAEVKAASTSGGSSGDSPPRTPPKKKHGHRHSHHHHHHHHHGKGKGKGKEDTPETKTNKSSARTPTETKRAPQREAAAFPKLQHSDDVAAGSAAATNSAGIEMQSMSSAATEAPVSSSRRGTDEPRQSLVVGITGKIDRMRQKLGSTLSLSKQIIASAHAHSDSLDYDDFLQTKRIRRSKTQVQPLPTFYKGCPIDPRHPFLRVWTVIMLLCILFECTITPFGIGFLPLTAGPTALDVTEAVLDLLFIADLGINFCTAIRGLDGRLIKSYRVIAANYYSRDFWIDLFTSIPFSLVIVLIETFTMGDPNIVFDIEVLQMVRLLLWTACCDFRRELTGYRTIVTHR